MFYNHIDKIQLLPISTYPDLHDVQAAFVHTEQSNEQAMQDFADK